VEEAKTLVSTLEGDDKANGELYIKVMEKAADQARGVGPMEGQGPLDRMLASSSVPAAKADEMSRKSSIIGALLGDE
jgi:protein disulfide-isomerase A6